MDDIAESGEEIVITKNGQPVSGLAPDRARPRLPFGRSRDKIRIKGDIVSPMPAEWFEGSSDEDQF